MQSVTISTKVVSSNFTHDEVYSIQHYVIKFLSDLRQAGAFLLGTPVSSTNKTDRHNIVEILLKVALNTILTPMSKDNFLKHEIQQNTVMAKNIIIYKIRTTTPTNPQTTTETATEI